MSARKKRTASVQPHEVNSDNNESKFKSVSSINEEQKRLIQKIHQNDVIIVKAPAGAGKTYISCGLAAYYLHNALVDRIIISRPVVATEEIGYLKGSLEDKLDPYVAPIFDELSKFMNVKQAIDKRQLIILPVAFMRGWNFTNSFVLIDESQNLSYTQIKLVITRLCENSKIIFAGDPTQSDLDSRHKEDFTKFISRSSRLAEDPNNRVAIVELTKSVRHRLVEKFIEVL